MNRFIHNHTKKFAVVDSVAKRINMLKGLYSAHGHKGYIGEPISQIQHAAQAATLAKNTSHSDEVVCAAFLHDIGHMLVSRDFHLEKMVTNGIDYGVKNHERVGAIFAYEVTESLTISNLINNHVIAKRYMAGKYPHYHDTLSPASRQTLKFQGGPLTKEEQVELERDPLFPIYISMRRWDDKAKDPNLEIPQQEINGFWNMLQGVIERNTKKKWIRPGDTIPESWRM